MPIDVTCTGCKARFQVSDKFAGKQGPCPKCKTVIQVPEKSEQVVVHAPEVTGPKDSKGTAVLKPITRKDTRLTPLLLTCLIGSVLLVLGGAIGLRYLYPLPPPEKPVPGQMARKAAKPVERPVPTAFLALGAIILAPPLCWAGYSFLRDDELEAISGKELLTRTAICSASYALLWAIYLLVKSLALGGVSPDATTMLWLVPPFVVAGGAAGYGCFNLTYSVGLVHYGFYLVCTVLLRLVIGLSVL